tara:strand:+ start:10291 stop:10680 length:390 start_codon:yes stop_codon:yes gene_type:complete
MDGNVRAKFYEEPRANGSATLVEISVVGDPSTCVAKVREEHKQRFPKEWAAFSEGHAPDPVEGTPLTDVKGIGPKLAAKLIANDIHTAEQLASVHDGGLDAVGMGAYTHRQSARELLGDKKEEPVGLVG